MIHTIVNCTAAISGKVVSVTTEVASTPDQAASTLSRRIADTEDSLIREALIALGWIPPEEAAGINQAHQPALEQPLGFMNSDHVHEMQQGRLPYGYVYPKGGMGADVAVYTVPQPAQQKGVAV